MDHPVVELGKFLSSAIGWIWGAEWIGSVVAFVMLALAILYIVWVERLQDRHYDRHFWRRLNRKRDKSDDEQGPSG